MKNLVLVLLVSISPAVLAWVWALLSIYPRSAPRVDSWWGRATRKISKMDSSRNGEVR